MSWRLEPNALEALRDQLLERGKFVEVGAETRSWTGSLVDNSPEAEALLRRVEPFLELLFLMMSSDGECHERERQLLRGVTRTLGGADLPCATIERLLTVFDAHVEQEGVESRLEAVARGLAADRLDAESAFTLTATMALADDDVGAHEHAVLDHLAEMLGISASRAHELVAQCPLKARTRPAP